MFLRVNLQAFHSVLGMYDVLLVLGSRVLLCHFVESSLFALWLSLDDLCALGSAVCWLLGLNLYLFAYFLFYRCFLF